MKIVVFTSSRADFGICLPLLKKIKEDKFFELILIVFGTHLSNTFGKTASEIIESGFDIDYKIETTPDSDTPESITNSMGDTIVKFSEIWNSNKFDYVLALGDRYEMFSACVSTIPFNIPIAHIHGGEETRGAIDNIFRHCITLMSKCHFTTTNIYKERVVSILGNDKNVYTVGA
jgi:GDP/UDP-N,N'-diacetylbacillosamine 2-epimerase (hydrolysing)